MRKPLVDHPAGEERVRQGVELEIVRDGETRSTEPRQARVLFVEAELMCLFVVHSARHHSAADTILGPWVEASSGS